MTSRSQKKLVALSAAGVGVLAASTAVAPNAHAGIIYSGIMDHEIDSAPHGTHRWTLPSPFSNAGLFGIDSTSASGRKGYDVAFFGGSFSAALKLVSAGMKWSQVTRAAPSFSLVLAGRSTRGFSTQPVTSTKKYELVRFRLGGQFDYGWIQFSATLNGFEGLPSATLVDMAYDDSGAQIAAGDVGSPTPEPASAALAALVLGAAGLRRWRKR